MQGDRDTGSDFICKKTIRPGEDPENVEARWYRRNKESGEWEFYGNDGPPWDELSEGAKDTFTEAYRFIFESAYRKKRREAITRGIAPEELPEDPGSILDILYYLRKAGHGEEPD